MALIIFPLYSVFTSQSHFHVVYALTCECITCLMLRRKSLFTTNTHSGCFAIERGFRFLQIPTPTFLPLSSPPAVGWPLKKHSPSNLLQLLLPGCWKMPQQPSCAQMLLLFFIVMPRSITPAAWFPHACDMATTLELDELNIAADANG